ncbi:MAG TPA: ATP-binding cassette domain-containing protein [Spongiibacteraceae bacterium]|nr:ATP-binding cassette domain-containing protein [Spongiibacteraceae bacterium]
MSLLRLNQVALHYGEQILLAGVDFQIDKGERVCLVGRNGVGKSTFLRLLEGGIKPDGGECWLRPGLRHARLEQEPRTSEERTVYAEVASGLAGVAELLAAYHELAQNLHSDAELRKLETLQQQLDTADAWSFSQRIDTVLSRLNLPADQPLATLSGGWLRRVALARALVLDPELLLLDEPTNHLDIATIDWLEGQLLDFNGAVLYITHDRALARRLATRVVELDRGKLISYTDNSHLNIYDSFIEQRDQRLEIETREQALFDKNLAEEERWIRQGVKARRTRNEGRVRALKKLREERAQRRNVIGDAKFGLEGAERSGKLVAELNRVTYSIDDKQLIGGLDLTVMRGDRVGLIGPNGAGKSTLLRLILGELEPTGGEVRRGERLQVAYFDQLRNRFDEDATLVDIVGQGRDFIDINGQRRHIISYLEDFLFRPDQSRRSAKYLSGGERARLQLARLFSLPVNLLVLDEPTNDLDVESLQLLEQLLLEFDGTILLVSHDREFLDNVVTSSVVFEGEGKVEEYVGGYTDWLRQRAKPKTVSIELKASAPKTSPAAAAAQPVDKKVKLSYKLQRELDELPKTIETLEARVAALNAEAAGSDFYQREAAQVTAFLQQIASAQLELDQAYARWVELSEG